MSDRPYMKFYPSDYFGDTMHLSSPELHGCYLLLLLNMWNRPSCSLPNDPKELAYLCRISTRKFSKVWQEISSFFEEKDGEISHKRLEKDRKEVEERSEKGKINAKKRWEEETKLAENSQSVNATPYASQHAVGICQNDASGIEKNDASIAIAIAIDKEPPMIPQGGSTDLFQAESQEEVKPKPPRPKRKRAISIPDDFPDAEALNYAAEHWREHQRPDIDCHTQAAKFRDHHLAKGTTMKDWRAAWRTWCRNSLEYTRGPSFPQRAAAPSKSSVSPEDWKNRVRNYRSNGAWSKNWGPNPDEPGCQAPVPKLSGKLPFLERRAG
jgi:uncharacterized protein YdaU (DUF1376 family)